MANPAPGVSVNVSASSGNPRNNAPTGTWFVIGTAHGPSGVAVPVNSLNDFNTYFGSIVNGSLTGRYAGTTVSSTTLYDALDVYFREGGVAAYVSRVNASTSTAAVPAVYPYTTSYQTAVTTPSLTFAPLSAGTWAANAASAAAPSGSAGVALTLSWVSGSGASLVYTAQITLNGNVIATSPSLSLQTDLIGWLGSLPAYQQLIKVATVVSTTSNILPSSTNVKMVAIFSAGTDVAVADADIAAALTPFTDAYGQGQVSYPGCTTATCYATLTQHAQTYNRVAFLDGADPAGVDNSATLVSAVATLQTATLNGSAVDPSYAAMFAPNLIVPGIVTTNASNTAGVVFNRSVPSSALAAARVAYMDTFNDCNVPAAGTGPGSSSYAIGLSFYYSGAQRATLNNGGVNTIRLVPTLNQIALYGFRSCAFDQNWVFLNNVRFRMQAIRDFTLISENFMFDEIDGRGQVFANLGGQLAGQCQAYWLRKSIYGTNPGDSFTVNTGPQVNNPATIAAGQINAQVNMRMAPFGEFVTINVTKYTTNAALPNYNA